MRRRVSSKFLAMAKSKTYRGIRISLPAPYQTVVGSIIAHWGLFETELWHTIEGLRRSPEIKALSEQIPAKFEQRMKFLKDAFRLIYKECPTLAEKLCGLISEANHLVNDCDLIMVDGVSAGIPSRSTVWAGAVSNIKHILLKN